MNQYVQDVFSGRLHSSYYLDSPFAEERARNLAHLLERCWARETVVGAASKLVAIAKRVDITTAGGVTAAQIEAAADDWMKQPLHYFRRDIGPRKARTKFVSDATNWLRFLGGLNEPECPPAPHDDLVVEFTSFLEHERGLSPATIRRRHGDALSFLTWLDQQHRPLSEVSILNVKRSLALPRSRPWSRVTVAGCVASLRSFFRYAGPVTKNEANPTAFLSGLSASVALGEGCRTGIRNSFIGNHYFGVRLTGVPTVENLALTALVEV